MGTRTVCGPQPDESRRPLHLHRSSPHGARQTRTREGRQRESFELLVHGTTASDFTEHFQVPAICPYLRALVISDQHPRK